jgi:glutaminase
MDFQPVLDQINAELRPLLGQGGKVASYIPALARVSPLQFGIALRTCEGETAQAGDSAVPFSIQSMSKVFSLTLAIRALDEALHQCRRHRGGGPAGVAGRCQGGAAGLAGPALRRAGPH